MMRLIRWLLLAAFLFLVGACPSVATAIGATLGLVFAGALELLAQPPVFALAGGLLIVAVYRNRHDSTPRRTA